MSGSSPSTETNRQAPFPKVLVMLGLDHRDQSVLDALELGAEALGAADVHVCHVSNRDPLPPVLASLGQAEVPSAPPELQAAVDRLREAFGTRRVVHSHHLIGPPEVVLSDVIEKLDVDLVIMGRNPAVDGQPGWGSARRKLLRLTTCSVLVVPHGTALNLDRIVCGLDFSDFAKTALSVACRLGTGVDAVYQYDPSAVSDGGQKREDFREKVANAAERHLAENVLVDSGPGFARPNLIVHPGGKVAEVLIRYAGEAPIVMGSRGLSPLAAMLLGSSADRVAGRALGPVLIVRRKGTVLGLLERLVHRG